MSDRKVLEFRPTAETWFGLGSDAFKANNFSEAEKCLTEATKLNPGHAKAFYCLGLTQEALGNEEEALISFISASGCQPNWVAAQFAAGRLHYQRGNLEQAACRFETVVSLRTDELDAYYYLGLIYGKLVLAEKEHAAWKTFLQFGGQNSAKAVIARGRLFLLEPLLKSVKERRIHLAS